MRIWVNRRQQLLMRIFVCQVYDAVACAFNIRHGYFRPFVSSYIVLTAKHASQHLYTNTQTHTHNQLESIRKKRSQSKKSKPFPFFFLHHHLLSVSLFGVVSSAKAVYILRQSHYRSDLCRLALNMRHPPQDNAIENDSREKKKAKKKRKRESFCWLWVCNTCKSDILRREENFQDRGEMFACSRLGGICKTKLSEEGRKRVIWYFTSGNEHTYQVAVCYALLFPFS